MKTSGICFVHRSGDSDDETEYVAPDLLPEGPEALRDELAVRWEPWPDEPLESNFVYPFLPPAITRSVLSDLGGLAGATALYWRYGLCLYDGESRATAMVEEISDTEGYGGRIRIRAKGEGAATLLARLVARIRELDEYSGWSGQLLEPPPVTGSDSDPEQIQPATPPPTVPDKPEVYISYAWARERQDPLVDGLCAEMEGQGRHIRRDSTELQPGDRISHYMERLSAGRCVVVVLSRDYLRSEYCMTELYRLYTNARQWDENFLRRIVPLIQDDACIGSLRECADHALYWKTEYDALDRLTREHGIEILGQEGAPRFLRIGGFYRRVTDMLTYANGVLIPRDRLSLSKDNFKLVKELIDRAIA